MKNKWYMYTFISLVFIFCGFLYISTKYKENDEDIYLNKRMEIIQPIEESEKVEDDDQQELKENQENLKEDLKEDLKEESKENGESTEIQTCTVYICGAVKNPGVYTLQQGNRVVNVLEMAGGSLEDADLNQLNLAAVIVDAEKIYIPKMGEQIDKYVLEEENRYVGNPDQKENQVEKNDGLVDINKASSKELETLPGIGPVIAQNIIDYRESNGRFQSIEDIQNVSRIGLKTFEKMKEKITVR